jgi:RNA polymerase sigma factor (sigma-70 family)
VDVEYAEAVFRRESSAVLGALMRQYGDLDVAEDGYQDACLRAWQTWPTAGVPDKPGAWLLTVARRRITDRIRRESLRAERERSSRLAVGELDGDGPQRADAAFLDDQLLLLFMCSHPALSDDARIALTLRSVAGLTTTEIARAFFVPEQTMAQRLVRAKRKIARAGISFDVSLREVPDRMESVCRVLYLVFNEGYASSGVDEIVRTDLCDEAILLARLLVRLAPKDSEALGLLALMLLHDSRRTARVGSAGELIPLDEQDRRRWNRSMIDEADSMVSTALATGPLGPYKLQAAIAALHTASPTFEETDWVELLALYDLLITIDTGPAARLGRVVALSMVDGPAVGLAELDRVDADVLGHRVHSVRAHLLERLGRTQEARKEFLQAAELATSPQESAYLRHRAARLGD